MTERPILFSGSMVPAIIDGRKTQTRRVMRPQPLSYVPEWPPHWDAETSGAMWGSRRGDHGQRCPYGVPGDRLWVRESFMPSPIEVPPEKPQPTRWMIAYAAGGQDERKAAPGYNPMLYNYERWTPGMFMPRWASRLTLEVVDVRVQQLQEITIGDAHREGAPMEFNHPDQTRAWFPQLWDSINAKRAPWASNPWVWAVTFKRVP